MPVCGYRAGYFGLKYSWASQTSRLVSDDHGALLAGSGSAFLVGGTFGADLRGDKKINQATVGSIDFRPSGAYGGARKLRD